MLNLTYILPTITVLLLIISLMLIRYLKYTDKQAQKYDDSVTDLDMILDDNSYEIYVRNMNKFHKKIKRILWLIISFIILTFVSLVITFLYLIQ